MTLPRYILLPTLFFAAPAWTADPAGPSANGSLAQLFSGLILTLALLLAALWLFKRLRFSVAGAQIPVKILGGATLGQRERIVIVDIAGQALALGVTAHSINVLTTLPEEALHALKKTAPPHPAFPQWLQRAMQAKNTSLTPPAS